jgi:hypothetical protein
VAVVVLVAMATQASGLVASADPNATIEGSFGDSCRDFEAHSSKDISHVEIRYADGRVVKDETVDSPDYSIDGGAGDEISSAIVKSGTTRQQFDCVADSPPAALLEAKKMAGDQAGEWTSDDRPLCTTSGRTTACWNGDQCDDVGGPPTTPVPFRGTGSTDPDGDIVRWSIDFGDGTGTEVRSWTDDPPTEVSHTYQGNEGGYNAVLTIADSSGNSSSDSMIVVVAYCQTND